MHTKTTTVETPSTTRMITARSTTLLPNPAFHSDSSTGYRVPLLLAPTPLLCFGFGCLIVGAAADPASRAVLGNAPLDAGSVAEVKDEVFIVPVFAPRAGVLPPLDETHACQC
jgi:hypothetical protein